MPPVVEALAGLLVQSVVAGSRSPEEIRKTVELAYLAGRQEAELEALEERIAKLEKQR